MILALDTSGALAVVASVTPDGQVTAALTGSHPRAHAEELAPLVARAVPDPRSVSHIVVGRGPGSFTGLRVGLAFAQAWAWATGTPVTGICSLDVIATQTDLTDGWIVMDARRNELFAAHYRAGRRTADPTVITRGEGASLPPPVAGDVALIGEPNRRVTGSTRMDPAALAATAVRAVQTEPEGSTQPDYVRRPDVTMTAANIPGGLP